MAPRTLFHGERLVTGVPGEAELRDAGVLAEGGEIVAVGVTEELRREWSPEEEVGGAGLALMPGLVDAHQHAYGTSSLQLGVPDLPVEEWVPAMLGVSGPSTYADASYLAAKLIAGGVTTTMYSHFPHSDDPIEETAPVLDAFADSGMRLAVGVGYMDRSRFVNGDDERFVSTLPSALADFARRQLPDGSVESYLQAFREMRAKLEGSHRRVLLGPAGCRWVTEGAMEAIADAIEPGVGLHMHLLDGPDERPFLEAEMGGPMFHWLDRIGALGPTTSLTHLMFVGGEDIDLFAERGVTAIPNVSGNLRLGVGVTPIGEMRAKGVPVAIGTDDLSITHDDDMFAELRLAVTLARLERDWIDAADALRIATSFGAGAAQFPEVGTLAVGQRADVVFLDDRELRRPVTHPEVEEVDLILAKATAGHVRSVVIDGELVYADGRHLTIDMPALEEQIRSETETALADPAAKRRRAMAREIAARKAAFVAAEEEAAA